MLVKERGQLEGQHNHQELDPDGFIDALQDSVHYAAESKKPINNATKDQAAMIYQAVRRSVAEKAVAASKRGLGVIGRGGRAAPGYVDPQTIEGMVGARLEEMEARLQRGETVDSVFGEFILLGDVKATSAKEKSDGTPLKGDDDGAKDKTKQKTRRSSSSGASPGKDEKGSQSKESKKRKSWKDKEKQFAEIAAKFNRPEPKPFVPRSSSQKQGSQYGSSSQTAARRSVVEKLVMRGSVKGSPRKSRSSTTTSRGIPVSIVRA